MRQTLDGLHSRYNVERLEYKDKTELQHYCMLHELFGSVLFGRIFMQRNFFISQPKRRFLTVCA